MNRELVKSNLEIFETLLENVLIMFKNRGYIKNFTTQVSIYACGQNH